MYKVTDKTRALARRLSDHPHGGTTSFGRLLAGDFDAAPRSARQLRRATLRKQRIEAKKQSMKGRVHD